MLKENLIELYQKSFRENKELPALSDYFKKESFSYFEMATNAPVKESPAPTVSATST